MAAITQAQAGAYSSSSTWVGGVPPGGGDTFIQTYDLIVDVNTIVGHSPAAGDAIQAILVSGSGITLTINEDVQLTVRGDFFIEQGNLTINPGVVIEMDSSQAAAPLATEYVIKWGSSISYYTTVDLTFTGTAAKPILIQKNDSGTNYDMTHTWGVGVVDISYIHFTGMANAYLYGNKTYTLNHAVFENFTGIVRPRPRSASSAASITNIEIHKAGSSSIGCVVEAASPTGAAERTFTGNFIDCRALIYGNDWTLDRSIFKRVQFLGISVASAKNTIYFGRNQIAGGYLFSSSSQAVATLEDTLFYYTNDETASHTEGTVNHWGGVTVTGGVVDSDNNGNVENTVYFMVNEQTALPLLGVGMYSVLFGPNAAGGASARPSHQKGSVFTKTIIENCTFLNNYTNGYGHPPGFPVCWGLGSHGYTGSVKSFRNNLMFTNSAPPANTTIIDNGTSECYFTGTGLAGSSTTVLVTDKTFGTNPLRHLNDAYHLKVTSGPSSGEKRLVTDNDNDTVTVGVAFSSTLEGATYTLYPVDQLGDVSNNAFFGYQANNTIKDENDDVYSTTLVGYADFWSSNPSAIGQDDIIADYNEVSFIDLDRSIATFATRYLGNDVAILWADSTAYTLGDNISIKDAGFYNNYDVNFVCIQAHTSSAATQPGNYTTDWRDHWELQSWTEIKKNVLDKADKNPEATQANYLAWAREGYSPTTSALAGAGYDGSDIGAMPVQVSAGVLQSIMIGRQRGVVLRPAIG